jgi:hypothetical protein
MSLFIALVVIFIIVIPTINYIYDMIKEGNKSIMEDCYEEGKRHKGYERLPNDI